MSFSTDPKVASQHPTLTIGELGEQLVASWLQTQNWKILHHRWRCRWGEIDLIALQEERGEGGKGEQGREGEQENALPTFGINGQLKSLQTTSLNAITPSPSHPQTKSRYASSPSPILAFVEVKTRSPRNWDADGRLAITPQKQAKLWQAAQQFLGEYLDMANLPCRFDVALVNYQRVSVRSAESSSADARRLANASLSLSRHVRKPTLLGSVMQDEIASEKHFTTSSFSSEAVENAIPVSPIQLGQPIVIQGYQLILQDYIQSAFDGLL